MHTTAESLLDLHISTDRSRLCLQNCHQKLARIVGQLATDGPFTIPGKLGLGEKASCRPVRHSMCDLKEDTGFI